MSSYTIKKGSTIIANRVDGEQEVKTAGKDRAYLGPIENRDGWYIFNIKPGGLYSHLSVREQDVRVLPDLSIPDGEYELFSACDGKSIKLKLETDEEEGFFRGKQIIRFPGRKPKTWMGFAHIDEFGMLHVWKRYRGTVLTQRRVDALYSLQDEIEEAAEQEQGEPEPANECAGCFAPATILCVDCMTHCCENCSKGHVCA